MNAELLKKASDMVGNPNVLVNLVSRRVRQLNSGGGMDNHALVADAGNSRTADIALREVVEGKISWDVPVVLTHPAFRKIKRR